MSTRYGLTSMPTGVLSANELSKLSQDTVAKVTAFLKAYSKETLLAGQNARLLRVLTQYNEVQATGKAKTVVSQLEQADMERDQAFKTLDAFIKAHAYIKTEAVQAAFQLLLPVFKDYRKALSKSYEIQTAEASKLLTLLKTPDYQLAINQLNLGTHLANLETAQAKFEGLYQQRLREQATANPGKAKEVKKDLIGSYKLVVDLIAIFAYTQPDHAGYQDLLKQVNAIRSRYKKRKPKASDKGKEDKKAD